ncbi:MAG: Sjogren's syndrome/scleroderma autoantigen 1 family protein [Promethearchaeota archaeon]|jgi:uncharacterized Zn finger protein (UPF0148 family)
MADLLRLGHTMLNIACPVCNNPIFRNKSGEKYCPSCDRKVVVMNDKTAQTYQKKNLNSENNLSFQTNIKEAVYTSLEDGISTKIQWLIEKFRIETDIKLIRIYVDLISNLLDLLNKVHSTFTKVQ